MPLTRKEYLDACQICSKRSFDMNKGIICSLTKEHAAYEENTCPNFDLDELTQEKKAVRDQIRAAETLEAQTFGLAKFGIKNQMIAGIIIIALAVTWLVIGLNMGWIFYYPIILIIAGTVVLIQGMIAETKKAQLNNRKASSEILDDDL